MGLFEKKHPSEEYMHEYNKELKKSRSENDRKKARADARRHASGSDGFGGIMKSIGGMGAGMAKADKNLERMFGGGPRMGSSKSRDPMDAIFGFSAPTKPKHHKKKKGKSIRIVFDD
jgi:hypothetical protein